MSPRLAWNDLFIQPQWDGVPISERCRHRHAAEDFLAFMRERGGPVDADAIHAWLSRLVADHAASYAMNGLRTLRWLLRSDAVEQWRQLHRGRMTRTVEALHAEVYRPPCETRGPLADSIPEFLRHQVSLRRGARHRWALHRLDHFLAERGIRSMEQIDTALLSAFLATRRVSRRSCQLEVVALRLFFRWLRRTGRLQSAPESALVPHGRPKRHRPYIFSVKELAQLLAVARGRGEWEEMTAFTALHLIYACGLRISEAVRLRVSDADLDRRVLRMRKTKFGKSRQIPMGHRAVEYLRLYLSQRAERETRTGRLFVTRRGRRVLPDRLRDWFRRACLDAGLGRDGRWIRVHDLRHSFAVHRLYKWYAEGIEPQSKLLLLSIYMGHVAVECTAHYLQMGQDLMRVASRRCAQTLDDALQGWRHVRGAG